MRGRLMAVGLAGVLVLAGCGGDDGDGGDGGGDAAGDDTADTTTTTAAPEPLRILVSNDDGFAADGIDALVEGLLTLDDVEVTVSAPAENQSGTSDSTTPGEEPTSEVETQSGHPATAVEGFPADSVEAGLAAMAAEPPHLVIAGINEGQNIGPLTELSGTVGATRTGARGGIPSLGVSQGFYVSGGPEPAYETAVPLVLAWVEERRDELVAAEPVDGVAEAWNLNVPTCDGGELKDEVVETVVATEDQVGGDDLGAVDCTSAVTPDEIEHDVAGFLAGYPVLTPLTA